MKNKFNILDLFFGIKRKKEKIKDKEKKEKDKLISIEVIQNEDEFFEPQITPPPFFNTETNKDEHISKDETKKEQNNVKQKTLSIEENELTSEKETTTFTPTPVVNPNINNNTLELKSAIIEQVEKLIKEDYYEIMRIKDEIKIIEKQDQEQLNQEEIDKLIAQLNELIKRFEKLKKEFYSKNYDKINSGKLNDSYINNLIEDYKLALKESNIEQVDLIQISEIEEYIDIISSIATIEEESYKLNDNLEDKKEELDITDKEIDEYSKKENTIQKMNNYIDSFAKQQAQIINNLKKKVSEKDKITKTAEYKTELVINYSKLLTSTLLMAITPKIPQTKTGNLLKLGLIVCAISNMSKVVQTSTKETKVTTKITSIDYSSNIKEGLSNINEMEKMVSLSIKEIHDMKKEFQKDFSKYKHIMSEYTNMLAKLDSLEKELIVKQKLARDYENKLNETLEKNNVKVKRLEEEHFN